MGKNCLLAVRRSQPMMMALDLGNLASEFDVSVIHVVQSGRGTVRNIRLSEDGMWNIGIKHP